MSKKEITEKMLKEIEKRDKACEGHEKVVSGLLSFEQASQKIGTGNSTRRSEAVQRMASKKRKVKLPSNDLKRLWNLVGGWSEISHYTKPSLQFSEVGKCGRYARFGQLDCIYMSGNDAVHVFKEGVYFFSICMYYVGKRDAFNNFFKNQKPLTGITKEDYAKMYSIYPQ